MGFLRRSPAPAALLCAFTSIFASACGDDGPSFTDAQSIDAAPGVDADTSNARPGPVTALAATPSGIELDLAWQNPTDTDLDAILVVASPDGPVTFAPVDGTSYTVAQVVGTNQAVVSVAVATALPDIPTIPGLGIHFAAWARDTAGQYSQVPARTRGVNNALGTQSGMIQVFQDGTVTVTQQPRSLRLSGTATYDDAGDAMTVQLAVANQAGRIIFNLKGLVDSASQGTVINEPFPASGGMPMAYYGPEGLAIGASTSRQLDLTGIDGTVDPVVLTMHFVDAPALIFGNDGDVASTLDVAGTASSGEVTMPYNTCMRAEAWRGALSSDSRTLFTGSRSSPRLTSTDLGQLSASASTTLATTFGVGSVVDVALSPDGTRLYAVLLDGMHANGGNQSGECGGGFENLRVAQPGGMQAVFARSFVAHGGGPISTVRLVEIDPEDMHEVRRIDVRMDGPRAALAMLDGNRAAVVARDGVVALVDLTTFTLVDTDPSEPGVQSIQLEGDGLGAIEVHADGSAFLVPVTHDSGLRLVTVNATTFAQTTVDVSAPPAYEVVSLHRAVDGKAYVLYLEDCGKCSPDMLFVTVDGTQATVTTLYDRSPGFVFSADDSRYYLANNSQEVHVYARATHEELDADGDATNGVTWFTLADYASQRGPTLITPF